MKKAKIFKGICATVLAAATIGMIVPKAVNSFNSMNSNKSLQAAAEIGTTALTIDDVSVTTGKDFTMNVNISGVPSTGINCLEFAVKYDPTVVKIASAKGGDVIGSLTEDECYIDGDMICIAYASLDSKITKDGTLLSINGSALSDANKTTEFEVVPIDRSITPGSTDINSEIYIGYMDVTTGKVDTIKPDVKDGTGTLEIGKPVTTTAVTTVTTTTVTEPTTTVTEPVTTVTEPTTTVATTVKTTTTKPVTTKKTTTTAKPQPTEPAPLYEIGDVNCDGKISISDLVNLNKYLVNKASLTSVQAKSADVQTDGVLNVFDSVKLRSLFINK